jgi:hypothetical protein
MNKTLQDVSGKPSMTRKMLKYSTIFAIITCYLFGLLSILTGHDMGDNIAFVITALNSVLIGGGLTKMGMEHWSKNRQ